MARIEETRIFAKTGTEIIFRSILPADAENLLGFRRQIAAETTNTMQYVGQKYPPPEDTAKRLGEQLEDTTTINIGAFSGDALVGYLNFRMLWADHPWVAHLGQFGMMILREYWGLGIGKNLLRIQDEHARKIEATRIEAMVRVANRRGLQLYEKNGFRIEGTRRRAAFIENKFVDEYFIAKIIEEARISWRPPTLTTDRLILRPIELSDAASIFDYAKNPNVSKLTLWEPHRSLQDSLSYINDYVFQYYSEGVPEPFGIAMKSSPEKIIGTVGCFWTSKSARAMELAYAWAKTIGGRGL